jgi:hypothetical protein
MDNPDRLTILRTQITRQRKKNQTNKQTNKQTKNNENIKTTQYKKLKR